MEKGGGGKNESSAFSFFQDLTWFGFYYSESWSGSRILEEEKGKRVVFPGPERKKPDPVPNFMSPKTF